MEGMWASGQLLRTDARINLQKKMIRITRVCITNIINLRV